MASSQTTVTMVATVLQVTSGTTQGGGAATTRILYSLASDTGTSKAGISGGRAGATISAGTLLVDWPTANGTLPAVGDTLNVVFN